MHEQRAQAEVPVVEREWVDRRPATQWQQQAEGLRAHHVEVRARLLLDVPGGVELGRRARVEETDLQKHLLRHRVLRVRGSPRDGRDALLRTTGADLRLFDLEPWAGRAAPRLGGGALPWFPTLQGVAFCAQAGVLSTVHVAYDTTMHPRDVQQLRGSVHKARGKSVRLLPLSFDRLERKLGSNKLTGFAGGRNNRNPSVLGFFDACVRSPHDYCWHLMGVCGFLRKARKEHTLYAHPIKRADCRPGERVIVHFTHA